MRLVAWKNRKELKDGKWKLGYQLDWEWNGNAILCYNRKNEFRSTVNRGKNFPRVSPLIPIQIIPRRRTFNKSILSIDRWLCMKCLPPKHRRSYRDQNKRRGLWIENSEPIIPTDKSKQGGHRELIRIDQMPRFSTSKSMRLLNKYTTIEKQSHWSENITFPLFFLWRIVFRIINSRVRISSWRHVFEFMHNWNIFSQQVTNDISWAYKWDLIVGNFPFLSNFENVRNINIL